MAVHRIRDDIVKALVIIWIMVGILSFLFLITPFLLSPEVLYAATPECFWKIRYGKPCPLCGMTHAFILLSNGNIEEALNSNPYCLILYKVFLLNTAGLFLFSCVKAFRYVKIKYF